MKIKIDFFDLGLGILLAGIGLGLCLNWSFQDPIISACQDIVEELPMKDQAQGLRDCLELRGKIDE